MKSELRKDYLLNKYVIITPGRAKRPRDISEQTVLHRDKKCVFCPGNIEKKLIVDKCCGENKSPITAIKNKFPAVTLNNKKAYGEQEVIIETAKHGVELGELSIEEIGNVLRMHQKRTAALSKIKKIDYILVFKNNGSKAGASITHAHSQVFATDIIPPDVQEEMTAAEHYHTKHKRNAYADIIKKESKSKRKIFKDKFASAFCPYASQYHYEAWLFPNRFIDNITELNDEEINSFAKALKLILSKLNSIDVSYNFFMHQVISNPNQYFYIKIQPRDSVWAGVELGSGIVINSVSPEEAAKFYRK
ncbi:MAG: galactose-1-phosphate uridylyltransferase [Patescibacteria group bacterium]|jgi:UDPglucose--hexose-1-phosphate uridylyltransferase